MEEEAAPKRPDPRSSAEIFADLRALAQGDGALHEISAIIYRDWVVTVDVQEGRVTDDPEHRWSSSKLNKNELMLLLGLTVQSQSGRTFSVQIADDKFPERADQLLREFHDRVLEDGRWSLDKTSVKFVEDPESIGRAAREAIYYGADSFYLHQFSRFSRVRYRGDATWLLQNVGLSIRPMIDIAKFIVDRINGQMTAVGHMRKEGCYFTHGDLTNSLLISKADVRKKFGQKANAFISRFAIPVTGVNAGFVDPFAVNAVAISPIIDLGEHLYVPNQYRLYEAIYESPFYWMMGDKSYCDTAAVHRGAFLENTAAHIFRSVFGEHNVYENVTIRVGSKDIAGEIDVLVLYGEFVLVVQAKSKRVTLKARAGDTKALKADFEGAIQSPYRQALECTELIQKGAECFTGNGKALTFPSLPRLFPVVVLSDPFPGLTFLSGTMLERGENVAPVIWDLGMLDCVARLLPTPIEMVYYLKCRSEVFDKVISDSEYNFLGYHIRAKLALRDDVNWMMLDRDFATVVDNYMISADLGIGTPRPLGILERLQIPIVSDLLGELKNAGSSIAPVVMDLYDFSSTALEDLSARIADLREDVAATGKPIKAFSIPTTKGGMTYAVTRKLDANAKGAAEAIGAKHKYDTRSDRWYVILDSIETNIPIDGLLPLVWAWKEDEQEAERSKELAKLFNSRRENTDR
jgi:Nuclease-related domain